MNDIIRREQAIKAMKESEFGYTFEVDKAIEAVKALPTVDPEGSEDLISRKEMIRAVDNLGEDYISYYKLLLLIGRIPSAGTERKIIYCKDCKFAHLTTDGLCKYCGIWFPNEKTYVSGNHFCASAEKRNNDS